jgi:hypothetical protein
LGGQHISTRTNPRRSKYFLILPDSIGHGQSSKSSDGLQSDFLNTSSQI